MINGAQPHGHGKPPWPWLKKTTGIHAIVLRCEERSCPENSEPSNCCGAARLRILGSSTILKNLYLHLHLHLHLHLCLYLYLCVYVYIYIQYKQVAVVNTTNNTSRCFESVDFERITSKAYNSAKLSCERNLWFHTRIGMDIKKGISENEGSPKWLIWLIYKGENTTKHRWFSDTTVSGNLHIPRYAKNIQDLWFVVGVCFTSRNDLPKIHPARLDEQQTLLLGMRRTHISTSWHDGTTVLEQPFGKDDWLFTWTC